MGEKNPRDMLSKASWTLMEVMKDAASTNLTTALRTGQLNVDSREVAKLLTIVGASIEEGYHKGHKSFAKTVEAAINEVSVVLAREQAAAKKNAGRP